MLHLHHSHRLEALADVLAEVIGAVPDDPFRPEWVVRNGRPIESWLRAQLAQRLGICAHVRFLSPTSLIEEIVVQTLGLDRNVVRAWRAERVLWATLDAFGDRALMADERNAPVRRYLAGVSNGSPRAVQLARMIADQFQRYAVSRPDLVRAWTAGDVDSTDDWQPRLWRAVAARLGDAPPLATLLDSARTALGNGVPTSIPSRVTWLVQGTVAPLHMEAAVALADAGVDVHLLVPSARRETSTPAAHALGASLARHTSSVRTVIDAAAVGRDVGARDVAAAGSFGESMLARLQRDVVADVRRGPFGEAPEVLDDVDGSIRIHVCHGAARQADVLRDELLRLFDARRDLMPRDVLVLTPDVTGFAPLLASAFGATVPADDDTPALPRIPLRVLDQPSRVGNPVADVALGLLALASSRVDAVQVLDLVAQPCVRERYAIGEDDLREIRAWVVESGVRWGIDAAHRAEFGVPADAEHTWRFGFDRLLLGWALPGSGMFGGAAPYDEIEGQRAELLGAVVELCERVFACARSLASPRTIDEWCDVVGRAVAGLIDDGRETTAFRLAFDAALRAMRATAERNEVALELMAFRALLESRLEEPADARGDGMGAVTLASLTQGRARPARVVCLVGLDDGVFPRARRGAGFDLIAADPRPGDSDAAAEDRQSFLDALLAARETLVITYAGRRPDTNAAIAPAVPVAELLDTLDATFAFRSADGTTSSARSRLEIAHPLQPFSPRNFHGADGSYDAVHLAGARALSGPRKQPPAFLSHGVRVDGVSREVTVDALADFFANPSRALLARTLRITTGVDDVPATREPAALDSLAAHSLRDSVLRIALGGTVDDAVATRLRAVGLLPHGASGEIAFGDAQREAHRIARAARELLDATSKEPVDIALTIGGWRVTGRQHTRRVDGGILLAQSGKPRSKQIVALWVRHLVLQVATGEPCTSTLVGLADDEGKGGLCELAPVDDATNVLRRLLALYERGVATPLPFFPDTSREFAKVLTAENEQDPGERTRAIQKAREKFAPSSTRVPPESHDAAVNRFFPDVSVIDDATFADIALAVWRPLTACLSER